MNKFAENQIYFGFKCKKETEVKEISSIIYEFEHSKSGARLIYIDRDDDNKVFSISFKTTPENDTGVFHILEHSMLCGSDKYPVKEPFLDLLKGSMATFLNAFTYPDKTVYPVSSCNEKDFKNLMSVYLDAVFCPRFLNNKEIFMQEGWHYSIENEKDDIKYSGVVFNEMKGAYSSVYSRIDDTIGKALFPDSIYRFSSGGDPKHIPDLSYNDFIKTYKKYYHPENSYIIIYGNTNILEHLEYIDNNYLSKYNKENNLPIIEYQKPIICSLAESEYSINENESKENNCYFSYSCVLGNYSDREKIIALDILINYLTSTNDSPLKKYFIEKNVCSDMVSYISGDILQPYIVFELRKASDNYKNAFVNDLKYKLKDIMIKGIDQEAIIAEINSYDFALREGNQGGFPTGLIYSLDILKSWLYCNDPVIYLKYEDYINNIRNNLNNCYFENLINEILNSDHNAFTVVNPSDTLTKKENDLEERKLSDFKNTLSQNDIYELINAEKDLLYHQQLKDSSENIAKLPKLSLNDISTDVPERPLSVIKIKEKDVLYSDCKTNKIVYISYLFDITNFSRENLQYSALLTYLIDQLKTYKYTTLDLDKKIKTFFGNLSYNVSLIKNIKTDNLSKYFVIQSSMLKDNSKECRDLIEEIINNTIFEKEQVSKIVEQTKDYLKQELSTNALSYATKKAMSFESLEGINNEIIGGLSFYKFICDVFEQIQSDYDTLKNKLYEVYKSIFECNLTICVTSDKDSFENIKYNFINVSNNSVLLNCNNDVQVPEFPGNQAYIIPSSVNYVVKTINYNNTNINYTGKTKVLSRILSYDYLWNEIRVSGGAYGSGLSIARNNTGYMYSYRDPHIKETIDKYNDIIKYLDNFKQEDITNYIISISSLIFKPLSPRELGRTSQLNYLSGIDKEIRQNELDDILKTDINYIKSSSLMFKNSNHIIVFGNASEINKNKDLFSIIEQI